MALTLFVIAVVTWGKRSRCLGCKEYDDICIWHLHLTPAFDICNCHMCVLCSFVCYVCSVSLLSGFRCSIVCCSCLKRGLSTCGKTTSARTLLIPPGGASKQGGPRSSSAFVQSFRCLVPLKCSAVSSTKDTDWPWLLGPFVWAWRESRSVMWLVHKKCVVSLLAMFFT